uniref:Uncharacterized protein n=1 Tax=Plectus sambesii TaxID=2011161 RepID=A0A914WGB6_9BILA
MTVDDELVAELLQPHLNLLAASEGLVFDGSRVLTSSNSMKSLLAKITKNGIDVRFLDGTLEVNLALLTDDTLCSAANLSALVVLPFASTSYSLPTLTDATLLRIAQQKAPIHHFVFGSHMSTGFTINGIIALVKAWQNAEVSGVCRRLFPWLEDMKIWKFGRIRSTKDEFSTAFLSLPKSRIYLPTSMKYEAIALVENALDNHFELRVTCSLMN